MPNPPSFILSAPPETRKLGWSEDVCDCSSDLHINYGEGGVGVLF